MEESTTQMAYWGNLEVLSNLKRKKELLQNNNPDHHQIRTLLYCPPGGMGGAHQAGVGVAFEKLDLVDAFDTFVGSSSGAAVGLYTLAKQAELGASLIPNEFVAAKFINPLRFWKVMDIDYLQRLFSEIKPVDTDTLINSRTIFLVGVSTWPDGDSCYLNAKETNDPIKIVIASLNYPLLTGGTKIDIDGTQRIDGMLCEPYDFSDATDVLIALPNTPQFSRSGILKHPNFNFIHPIVNGIISHNTVLMNSLADQIHKAKENGSPNILFIYPQRTEVKSHTMNAQKLQNAITAARNFTINLTA